MPTAPLASTSPPQRLTLRLYRTAADGDRTRQRAAERIASLAPLDVEQLVYRLAWVVETRADALEIADLMHDRALERMSAAPLDSREAELDAALWRGIWAALLHVTRGDEAARFVARAAAGRCAGSAAVTLSPPSDAAAQADPTPPDHLRQRGEAPVDPGGAPPCSAAGVIQPPVRLP